MRSNIEPPPVETADGGPYAVGMRYSLCFLFAAALAATPSIGSAQMHAPTPMTKSQFETAATGASVQIMVRVADRQRDTLHGDLLETVGSSRYKKRAHASRSIFPERHSW